MTAKHQIAIKIPADHPCLPGHFPGRPVVPGALILAAVARAAEQVLKLAPGAGGRVDGFPAVKFSHPLLPEQACQLTLTDDGRETMLFELTHDSQRLASGSLHYQTRAAVN